MYYICNFFCTFENNFIVTHNVTCNLIKNKKPLKTVWPDCKAATKFEKID